MFSSHCLRTNIQAVNYIIYLRSSKLIQRYAIENQVSHYVTITETSLPFANLLHWKYKVQLIIKWHKHLDTEKHIIWVVAVVSLLYYVICKNYL